MSKLSKLDNLFQDDIETRRQKSKELIVFDDTSLLSKEPFYHTIDGCPYQENGVLSAVWWYSASTLKELFRILDEEFEDDKYIVGY